MRERNFHLRVYRYREELSGVVPINTQLQHTEIFSNDEVSITTDLQHDGEVDSSSQNALVTKFEENESGSDDGSEIAADADRETALKSEKDVAANTITQTDDNLATTNPANDMELIVTANVESRFQDSIITSSDSAAESRSDSGAATDLALNLSSQTELSNHPTEVTSLQTECNSTIKVNLIFSTKFFTVVFCFARFVVGDFDSFFLAAAHRSKVFTYCSL